MSSTVQSSAEQIFSIVSSEMYALFFYRVEIFALYPNHLLELSARNAFIDKFVKEFFVTYCHIEHPLLSFTISRIFE